MEVTILDYGIGNVGSVANMVRKIGATTILASSPEQVEGASLLIMAGIGSFDANMSALRSSGLEDSLLRVIKGGTVPVLGICLGMQILCRSSEEGSLPGLGIVDAQVRKIRFQDSSPLKVPHMGWNEIHVNRSSRLMDQSIENQRYYFCHSYFVDCANTVDVVMTTTYGSKFVSGFAYKNIFGVQFHPEKSHSFGMRLLKNFIGV